MGQEAKQGLTLAEIRHLQDWARQQRNFYRTGLMNPTPKRSKEYIQGLIDGNLAFCQELERAM